MAKLTPEIRKQIIDAMDALELAEGATPGIASTAQAQGSQVAPPGGGITPNWRIIWETQQ